jgi:prepilin-type N-terminal cleavage/methylation domain-containing protein
MKAKVEKKIAKGQKGFGLVEIIVVLLVLAILVVLALPQMIASRRAFRFSGIQRQIASTLSQARQEAMTQNLPISFHYDNAVKKIYIHGGKFGALGDPKNQSVELSGSGLESDDIVYGRPNGPVTTPLADSTNMTPLVANAAKLTFYSDGSVLDASKLPQNNALFFYNRKHPGDMAFAVSVLGAGGRVKIWRYNKNTNSYVE